jgi:hypothetical protein
MPNIKIDVNQVPLRNINASTSTAVPMSTFRNPKVRISFKDTGAPLGLLPVIKDEKPGAAMYTLCILRA